MKQTDPTLLGHVVSVSGSTISVHLSKSISSGLAIIRGSTYRIGQVGSFVRVPQGYQDLFGIVTGIGASAAPESTPHPEQDSGRWMKAELVGESIGGSFERGIGQYPNINDSVHMVTEEDLWRIYGVEGNEQIHIGRLSSAENIKVKVDLEKLVTRHSAILGSTGSGKSTTVSSLLRSIAHPSDSEKKYQSARILMLDIHGEYASALSDVATVFKTYPSKDSEERHLHIPYWALDGADLVSFLFGGVSDNQTVAIFDSITSSKLEQVKTGDYKGVSEQTLTIDTPIPFSLKQLWYELIEPEVRTYRDVQRTDPAIKNKGDPDTLIPPEYEPATTTNTAPFINQTALGIRRQLVALRSRLLDHRYDFLLHPGEWEPSLDGSVAKDLDKLLESWLGHNKPITVLDLSGIPSEVLTRLIGSILKIIYEAMFWSRGRVEGAIERPILVIMEEAHRYLAPDNSGLAMQMVQRIVKEGRKYGIGAMIISQRPSEVDDTILSQCGTFFALRLSNPSDRSKVQGALPDSLSSIIDMLPVLRTGEAIVTGEAARMPLRCRITLPEEKYRPDSMDPKVAEKWLLERREEDYSSVIEAWRAQGEIQKTE